MAKIKQLIGNLWGDIKGNAKWDFIKFGAAGILALICFCWNWRGGVILWLAGFICFIALFIFAWRRTVSKNIIFLCPWLISFVLAVILLIRSYSPSSHQIVAAITPQTEAVSIGGQNGMINGKTFEQWMNDDRPGMVKEAALELMRQSNYVNAVTLFRHVKAVENGDLSWRGAYPQYVALLLLAGNKKEGQQEFQYMTNAVERMEKPYDTWNSRRELLNGLEYANDLLSGDDGESFRALITKLQNIQFSTNPNR